MKKTTKRFLSLAIGLAIMLSTAVVVSAGSVDWAGSDGYTYTATTSAGSTYVISVPVSDATTILHESGEDEVITWPTGNNATHEANYPNSVKAYESYLEAALKKDGLASMATSNIPSKDYYVLDPDLPEKKYSYGFEVTVCDVTCTIRRSRIQMNQTYALVQPYATGVLEEAVISYTTCKLIVMGE